MYEQLAEIHLYEKRYDFEYVRGILFELRYDNEKKPMIRLS